MHVIDGTSPALSTYEESRIASVSSYSNIDLIDVNAQPHVPSQSIFGGEPQHTWCYYFQKASLASQNADWNTVVELGNEAWKLELRPEDKSEWLVFLKAYAILNRFDEARKIVKDFKKDEYQVFQVCEDLSIFPEMQKMLGSAFCKR